MFIVSYAAKTLIRGGALMQMASISVQGEYAELLPKITDEIKRRKGAVAAAA